MDMKASCSVILLIFAIVGLVNTANAQCSTNGCTSCTSEELICNGLNVAPQSQLQNLGTNIQRISLTNGAISDIPDGFFALSELVSIDLSNNLLTTLNIESLEYASSLRTINLTGNPIVCDSNIDWLNKWKNFYPPGNEVRGTCSDGADINTYLSDKPGNLVTIKFAEASLAFRRSCLEITLPFVIYGNFTSDLTYRAVVTGSTVLTLVDEEVTVPVSTNSSTFTITVTNRGEDRSNETALLWIYSKYPVSYETQVELTLANDEKLNCIAPVPGEEATTPAPVVTTTQTSSQQTEKTTEQKTAPKTGPPTEVPTKLPPSPTPGDKHSIVWVIILIIIIVCVGAVLLGIFLYKKFKTPNKTAGDKPVEYKVVSGDGDGKVYSDTTKDAV